MKRDKIQLKNVTLLGIDCIDTERLQKALDISLRHLDFAAVKLLTSLNTDSIFKINIDPIRSKEEYSEFCIRELYKYVDTEFLLLVQHDGFVLQPFSWTDRFLQYDYIGAPWRANQGLFREMRFPVYQRYLVGNGGFSLRSKKLLELTANLASQGFMERRHPEDVAICVWNKRQLKAGGVMFAPSGLAACFSIEGGTHDRQFGFHDHSITDISAWKCENPVWE